MNIDSHLLKLHQPMHTPLAGPLPTSPLERDSLGAAPAWASSAREIDRQCLRVLHCTARALAAGAGGLRFTPGARPWLDGLVPAAAMPSGQGGGGRHASSPELRS